MATIAAVSHAPGFVPAGQPTMNSFDNFGGQQVQQQFPAPAPMLSDKCKCICGLPMIGKQSKSQKNPGRWFWTCSKGKDDSCGNFCWFGDEGTYQPRAKKPRVGYGGGGFSGAQVQTVDFGPLYTKLNVMEAKIGALTQTIDMLIQNINAGTVGTNP